MPTRTSNIQVDKRHLFKKHKVQVVENTPEVQVFYCRDPKESEFWFRVVISDNCIALTGDIDSLMICPGYGRGINWLRGSIQSTHYAISKIPMTFKTKEFDRDSAEICMTEMVNECDPDDLPEYKEKYESILDDLKIGSIETAEQFYDAWYREGLDEPPDIEIITTRIWQQLSALIWLAEQLDEMNFTVAKKRWWTR